MREESVRPRLQLGASGRPLNFTVGRLSDLGHHLRCRCGHGTGNYACSRAFQPKVSAHWLRRRFTHNATRALLAFPRSRLSPRQLGSVRLRLDYACCTRRPCNSYYFGGSTCENGRVSDRQNLSWHILLRSMANLLHVRHDSRSLLLWRLPLTRRLT